MAAVDTNILLRLIVADDESQTARAEQSIRDHVSVFVPQVALAETCWVLDRTYGLSRDPIGDVVEWILEGSDFVLEQEEQTRAALALYRKSRADFADCMILESARAAGQLPLLTFDKALQKLDGTHRP